MDAAVLQAELQGDPADLGYAAHLPDAPGQIVDLLNAPTQTMVRERFVTARTVLAELDNGATILDKLEAAAASTPAVKWAMRFMLSDPGIDVGHPRTQGLLEQLAVAGVLTVDEASDVQMMALLPASRAEALFGAGARITEDDVRAAL